MNNEQTEQLNDDVSLDNMSDEELDEMIATDSNQSLDPWDH